MEHVEEALQHECLKQSIKFWSIPSIDDFQNFIGFNWLNLILHLL